MMGRLASLGAGIILLVLWGTGVFTAVTDWIPHAGHHGHAPTVAGYIAAYGFLILAAGMLLFFVALFLIPEDWI